MKELEPITPQFVKERVDNANVYDVAVVTALESAPKLSNRLENSVFLKREDTQAVFSFKLRGAYNKLATLSSEECKNGVIAASAGNHAQGVALSAKKLGIHATLVMPKTTPDIKVQQVKSFGAKVILHGNTYDEAYIHAQEIATLLEIIFIHPYDDIDVIAGQGTIAKEILDSAPDNLFAIFVPVGGGGLISGISAYVKTLHPQIKIIAVEAEDSACLHDALRDKQRTILDQVGIFADGVAVRQVGKLPFEIAQQCVDDVILVSTDEICAAIKDIFDDTRSIMEPAGALAVAGLKKYLLTNDVKQQSMVCINSGANMNFDRLRHVAERSELGEKREALFGVTIPERAGSFLKFCEIIKERGITEFNYRFADPSQAHIFVGIQLQGDMNEAKLLEETIKKENYPIIDLSDNEMAKIHIRYMVGGHSNSVENERLFRFEFPERPGALLRFLRQMSVNWNISLFHYRNHGAAYGRILLGVQVPKSDSIGFDQFLKEVAFPYWEESNNPAYKLFLS
ncbi:Threonine dehydratase biosynthetic [hydrothermal vent metagenome]|uniref:threonine ammonia-lyase n=1 Tax=hydrothermal vent metagenome TaxID=652676 RepID=A0A3B1ACM8_9ZZZZ